MKKNSILYFSDATMLAIHSISMLTKNFEKDKNSFLTTKEIASTLGASENHLSKVMQVLSKHGYIESIKGPSGGFRLKKDPKSITIKNIIELIEGPISYNFCPFFKNCPTNNCILGNEIIELSHKILELLDNITILEASRKFKLNTN
ncbi:MAG: Rrf2 family transcriptional regulator [Spirochaetes bacterium]|nr:Rrf2 family transcriptional regulator [Spirochaetota bacterium]